jgi:hypothetical protein
VGKVTIGVLAFVAGGVAGGLFVQWYAKRHGLELFGQAAGDQLFGEGSFGSAVLGGLGGLLDQRRAS